MELEYRYIPNAQVRADEEGGNISGYGIVFNADSQPLEIYDRANGVVRVVEQIKPESLRDADMTDVISAYNHKFELILGRTSSNTMKLSTDQTGVKYSVRMGSQSYAKDLQESIARGDVSGSSFVFTYDFEEGYEIEERDEHTLVATPKKITKVYEMGPVVNPAYLTTTAENRSSAIEKAARQHLAKRNEETDQPGPDLDETEESGPDTVEPAEDQPERSEETPEESQKRNIEYPFPKGYWKLKGKAKRRV